MLKCPYCPAKYPSGSKAALYEHIEAKHPGELHGMSPAQAVFNYRNSVSGGSCIMCRQSTVFSESTGKYERICDRADTQCREKYRQQFLERMQRVHGKDHLLDDMDQQKKMLARRSISGEYKWSDGKTVTPYTGTYELDFLQFLDHFMEWEPTDIMGPAPQIVAYEWDDGTQHSYIPDFWIPSIDMIVEIKASDDSDARYGNKDSNTHSYRDRELSKEKLKDAAVKRLGTRYSKVVDKDYSDFLSALMAARESDKP
jgi:hypothetical protein